jgi:serine/threonine protein kinase/tetratricopeptide (TPR) repeat protein
MKSHPSYELVGAVGQGRLATVYRARDLALNREVAIKELNDGARQDERLLQRFWDEARFLANVEHDNVVQIYGLDQQRGWVIMELAAGGLDSAVARAPTPPEVVRGVLRQVLDGLDCLHRQGRIHGGIKPSNLLVTHQGLVKLSDTTGVAGGPSTDLPAKYLAPEQLDPSFGPVGPGTDLYCLGFTTLELLAGPGFKALFVDPAVTVDDSALGWRRLHGGRDRAVPAAATVVPGLPPDLAGVIDRLLRKDVAERYASAADALKDLADVPSPAVPADPSPATLPPGMAPPVVPAGAAVPVAVANPPTVRGGNPGVNTNRSELSARETLLPTMFPVLQSPSGRGQPFGPVSVGSPPAGQAAPALETVRDTVRYPRWSRRWINQKLENPLVLYPVCGTIAFATVLLLADLLMRRRSTPPPPPPPTTDLRAVRVHSTPPGATVTIDGAKQAEKTDATYELQPGPRNLHLELKGYEPVDRTVEVPSDGDNPFPVKVELKRVVIITPPTTAPSPPSSGTTTTVVKPPTGTLSIGSTPGGATIYINGQDKGQTPKDIELPVGGYTVRLELARRKPLVKDVEIQSGQTVVEKPTLEPLREPGSFALLVGVRSAGGNLPIFQHAPGDMVELAHTLSAAGYQKENVKVLAQIPNAPSETVPTAENVRRAVKALVEDRVKKDTLLLALAGPVVAPGGGAAFFCPVDANLGRPDTLISLEGVFQELANCPARTKVVLLDGNRTAPPLAGRPPGGRVEELVPPGVVAILSTANGAPGYVHAEDRHGAFWDFVLHGLHGAAHGDSDGGVTADELARYVAKEVREHVATAYHAEQTPKLVDRDGQATVVVVANPDLGLKSLKEGDALLAAGDYAGAERKFSAAIDRRPDLVEPRVRRSVARFYLKKYADGIADCTEAIKLDPTCAAAYDLLGDAHTSSAGEGKDMNKEKVRQALENYNAAIDLDPDYGPFWRSRGAVHSRLQDYDGAVKDYTRAIDLAPVPYARNFNRRGRAYSNLDKYPEAVKDFTEAIRIKPDDDESYHQRGVVHRKLEGLYRQRGDARREREEKELAVTDFRKEEELKKKKAGSAPSPGKL